MLAWPLALPVSGVSATTAGIALPTTTPPLGRAVLTHRRTADAIDGGQLDLELDDLAPNGVGALALRNGKEFPQPTLLIEALRLLDRRRALFGWFDRRFVLVTHFLIMTQTASDGSHVHAIMSSRPIKSWPIAPMISRCFLPSKYPR